VKKRTIHFADEVVHLVTETLDPSASHYIDCLEGCTREHVQYFQVHFLGCMFGISARCPPPPTDEDDGAHVGRKTVTDGTRLNVLTHLQSETTYGKATSHFVRQGLDGFTLLYEGGGEMLTMKVRYSPPFIKNARRMDKLHATRWKTYIPPSWVICSCMMVYLLRLYTMMEQIWSQRRTIILDTIYN
jgi:hypothetical protein